MSTSINQWVCMRYSTACTRAFRLVLCDIQNDERGRNKNGVSCPGPLVRDPFWLDKVSAQSFGNCAPEGSGAQCGSLTSVQKVHTA